MSIKNIAILKVCSPLIFLSSKFSELLAFVPNPQWELELKVLKEQFDDIDVSALEKVKRRL